KSNSLEILGTKPVNTESPKASGKAEVGATLSCSTGTWTGVPTPTYAYQWLRDGTTIALATTSTYKVVGEDEGHSLSCEVTATNKPEGKAEAKATSPSSNFIHIPGSAPVNTEAPKATGTPAVGETLSCSTGTWTGAPPPTYTYQWLREEAAISGATESTHKVIAEDQGHKLSCKVTATNSEGTASQKSNSLEILGTKPVNTESPKASGKAEVGATLSCSTGTWTGVPTPTYTYQWVRSPSTKIAGATASTYTVSSEDQLHSLSCVVTATNTGGSTEAPSNSIAIPGSGPVNTKAPEVS